MAVIFGDIHGDINKVKLFFEYKPEKEHVALGDFVDTIKSGITLNDELACLDLLLSSDAVLIWGNHDLTYTPEAPWPCSPKHYLTVDEADYYAGYSDYLREVYKEIGDIFTRNIFTDRFLPHRERIKAAYSVDGWLCTHAGVSPEIAEIIPANVISAGTSEIATWLDDEFKREMCNKVPLTREEPQRYGFGPLFQVGYCRGGYHKFGGIFWFDPKQEMVDPSPLVGRQIFGHTRVPYPEIGVSWVNMNNYEEGIWIYDTETENLVDIDKNSTVSRGDTI